MQTMSVYEVMMMPPKKSSSNPKPAGMQPHDIIEPPMYFGGDIEEIMRSLEPL